jgi:hypothetical protein
MLTHAAHRISLQRVGHGHGTVAARRRHGVDQTAEPLRLRGLDQLEPMTTDNRPRASTWVFRGVVLLLFDILTAQQWKLQVVDARRLRTGRLPTGYGRRPTRRSAG